jgi:hypothetical protein
MGDSRQPEGTPGGQSPHYRGGHGGLLPIIGDSRYAALPVSAVDVLMLVLALYSGRLSKEFLGAKWGIRSPLLNTVAIQVNVTYYNIFIGYFRDSIRFTMVIV